MARQYKQSPTKIASNVRQMVDTFAPPIGLLAKLGSIIVHVDEGSGAGGHQFDWSAVGSLIADREVQDWLVGMDGAGLLPKRRDR